MNMKLTKERILKIQAKLKAEHDAYERKAVALAKRDGYERTPREFDGGFSIPYRPRLGIFKYTARSKNEFNPETFEAYSYGHWCYVARINGKVVFNEYRYSNTTTRHQGAMSSLLRQLGVKVDLYVSQSNRIRSNDDVQSLRQSLLNLYSELFQREIENARKGTRVKRDTRKLKQDIQRLIKFGVKVSKSEVEDKRKYRQSIETERVNRMKQAAAERKALRDRIKFIAKADPSTLNAKDIETETNSEVRKALVNRIGIAKVLKDLNAVSLDKQGTYELVNLKLPDAPNVWPREPDRPYLKMLNPSTGEVHVEGVPPHVTTVKAALAWRNGDVHPNDFKRPIKLT